MEYSEDKVKDMKERHLTVHEHVHHVKFETSHGCNLSCEFCGASKQDTGIMSTDTFYKALDGLTDSFKMAFFSGHGEPTLNPHLPEFATAIRSRFPKCQINIVTNMEVAKRKGFDYILELFESGVSQIQGDLYNKDTYDWFKASVEQNKEKILNAGIHVENYYQTGIGAFSYHGASKKRLIYVSEYEKFNSGDSCSRNFHNWAGNMKLELWDKYTKNTLHDFPMFKPCSEPLKYAYVMFNGDVTICCRNGGRAIIIGNVLKTSLEEIWQGQDAMVMRYLARTGNRKWMAPCFLCNFRSFRDGLTPYWGRKYTEEEIQTSLDRCHRVTKGNPLWENLQAYKDQTGKDLPRYLEELLQRSKEC